MKKIRIGNDIRLKVQLKFGEEQDILDVRHMRAVFVNSTLKKQLEDEYKKKNRFIGRFPIEPFVDEYEPTAYNINSNGHSKYRAFVANQYNGFGLHPDWKKATPVRDVNITEYCSNVDYGTTNKDSVIVTFPAEAQLYEGVYDLIITALVEDAGYSNHIRTVTTDYVGVFELVSKTDDADVDQRTLIEISNTDRVDDVSDIYVTSINYNDGGVTFKRNGAESIVVDLWGGDDDNG